jgi:hypothetical protein
MVFTKNELIALLVGILLAGISTMADSVPAITLGWSLVGIILCYIIYNQKHIAETFRILWCIPVIILGGWFIHILKEAKIERDAHQIFGTLFPSNMDTTELSSCKKTGGMAIYIGANTNCATQFPLPLLNIDGDPIITLDKTSSGEIVISYLLLNDENELNLASINGDVYWTNPNVRKEISHDRDQLVVYDTSGQRALVIEFMNPDHLSLGGEFYHHKFHVSITLQSIVAHFPKGRDAHLSDDSFFNHQIRVSKDEFSMFTPDLNSTSLVIRP